MSAVEPVVIAVELAVEPARAYSMFAARFADWWPAATHSLSRDAATRCLLDATPGGAVEEAAPDGARHRWGTVESVEPGQLLRFSWHPGREPDSAQWVEVRFAPVRAGTRVTLTHGGWEALGEIAPILRREYASVWRDVLEKSFGSYATAIESN